MDDRRKTIGTAGPQVLLITGGARSGKSRFAEQLAVQSGRAVAFIATATAHDDDMRARIARHQAERPRSWLTIEESYDLAKAVRQAAESADILILDCITLWLSNWLTVQMAASSDEISPAASAHYSEECLHAIDACLAAFLTLDASKRLLVVTNEVGLGIVPAYALGRLYRDMLGRVNQRLAAAATHVYLLVAGIAVDLKRLQEEITL